MEFKEMVAIASGKIASS